MSDRGRGRGLVQGPYAARPLGAAPAAAAGAGGRPVMGRPAVPGSRPLGSLPQRNSSGGLAALGAGGLSVPGGGSAAAMGAAGGRGAGPDHREVRYAEGVLAMVNILRLLMLGGPRTWDASMHKQVGMVLASRPGQGTAGREVNLLVNHFALGLRPDSSMQVYSLQVTDLEQQQQQQQQQPADAATAGSEQEQQQQQQRHLPGMLIQRVLCQLAGEASWPAGWVLVGADRVASSSALPANEAVVRLLPGSEADAAVHPEAASSSGTFKVVLRHLGAHDLSQLSGGMAAGGAAADGAAAGSSSNSSSGALLDGTKLLEALLLEALLQTPTAPLLPAPGSGAACVSGGGLPEPTPPIAVPGAAPASSGLMGLAGVAGGGSISSGSVGTALAGSAQLLGGLSTSPGGGLLGAAAGAPSPSAGGGLGGLAGAGASGGGGSSAPTPAACGFPGVRRLRVAGNVYWHAPGNPELHVPLGGGLEGWLGVRQAVLATQSGPAWALDLVAHPFYEPGPLPGLLAALLGCGAPAGVGDGAGASGGVPAALAALPPAEWERAGRLIQGLQVDVSLPGAPPRRVTVRALSPAGADATRFTLGAPRPGGAPLRGGLAPGAEVSVAAYMAAAYGCQLVAPGLPCVDVAKPGAARPVWYPLELASVPLGQRCWAPLSPPQLALLGRLGGKKAGDRRTWLEGVAAPLASSGGAGALGSPSDALLAAAGGLLGGGGPSSPGATNGAPAAGAGAPARMLPPGVEVPGLLGIVRGRVLPPPHLAYHTPECAYPGTQGQWNVKSCRLPGASRIASWALVALLPQAQVDLDGPAGIVPFLQDLTTSLNNAGLECGVPPIVYEETGLSVLQHLRAGCEAAQKHFNASPELLLVMLPARSAPLYAEVKVASDAGLGVPSQVLVAPVAGVGVGASPRGRLQYCANLGLKINAKLGGVNVRLAGNPDQVIPVIGCRPFMMFGVALAPPPRGARPGSPAAAAVVASRDRSLGRYSSRVLLQPWGEPGAGGAAGGDASGAARHAVAGLAGAARELLIDFYRQNGGVKPEALLLYRAADGPDSLAGSALLRAEYEALRAACTELEEGYCPPITFVAVSRAHSTRLFPADRDNQDKSGNVVPGTVVDSGICHPTQFDFFLNSHAGLQGHNKPAHYHVLVDENAFSADGLQLLTYWLCFLHCRCSRSVAVVPPVYYAQLAAQRGQTLAAGRELLEAAEAAAGGGEAAPSSQDGQRDFDVRVNARLGGSMYYI